MAHFDFDFYKAPDGTDHKGLFENQIIDKCPEYMANLENVVANGVDISREEFYTYGLFEDYNPLNPQFSSFRGFREIAKYRVPELNSIFSINGTVKFNYPGNSNQQICYAGCGGTLATTNKIFGLNNSEYVRIPEKKGRPAKGTVKGANKTLDFEYLYCNGERFFRVECKGMAGLNGNYNSKANDIIAKKNAQPAGAGDLSFGIITLIPVHPESGNAKCILVDPPTADLEINPKAFLFYSKLRFYASRLSNLGNPGWLRVIEDYIIKEDTNQNIGNNNYPYFSINSDIPLKMMFKLFFRLDDIFPLPYFYRSSIFRIYDKRVIVNIIEIEENNFLAYGFTRSLFEVMNRGTIDDFINFNEKHEELFWKGEVRLRKRSSENNKIFLSGNFSILSTGEVIGNLNSPD